MGRHARCTAYNGAHALIAMAFFSQLSASAYKLIFRALARRKPPHPRPINLSVKSRILCFTCAGIGDTLTDSVVFKALREKYPLAHLATVVHRRRKLLLEHNPYVNEVFLFNKGPAAFWKLQKELRAAGPWDAILQLRGNDPEPRCLSFMIDPDITVSVPNMTQLSELCGHQVLQPDWDATHGVEQTLRIARYVGATTDQPHLVYAVNEDEADRIEEKLRRMLVGSKPRLVLQLGGGRRAAWRDWPIERYAELIRLAAGRLHAQIFVLGGEDQVGRRQTLDSLFPDPVKPYYDMVNKLSLAESAALLSSAAALVSTDTGIMHMGFAVGTRVVALIHCNNPSNRVGPYCYGNRHRVVQLPRPPGYQTPADANMADISAETVFESLKEIWPQ
jgi:ADP-heptose:LPS heptosyltransferase